MASRNALKVVGLIASALGISLSFCPTARSQNIVRSRIIRPGQPPQTAMRPYLNAMPWNAAERGPLLTVIPLGEVPLERPLAAPDANPPAAAGTVAAAFGRKFVAVVGLTVLAPERMTVINLEPGAPLMSQDFQPHEATLLLLAGLTDTQWASLTGDGLTRAELDSSQRELYDTVLPGPVSARLMRYSASGESFHQEDGKSRNSCILSPSGSPRNGAAPASPIC